MANYIEREDDNLSSNDTVVSDPGNSNTEESEFLDRWDWLLSGWEIMSIAEKMQIFMPYLHYINLRDFTKAEFDEQLNKDIAENSFRLCRDFSGEFKFDPDQQGIPNMIIVYNPVDVDSIPYPALKTKVIAWGRKYGFYKEIPVIDDTIDSGCNCNPEQDHHCCGCHHN
jgi:hypothetical protein